MTTAPIEHQAAELKERADQLLAELRQIGEPYAAARAECARLRALGEPIIVTLASIGIPQGRIADAFKVTRETVRRIEILHDIDRGDPRAKRGSRHDAEEDDPEE